MWHETSVPSRVRPGAFVATERREATLFVVGALKLVFRERTSVFYRVMTAPPDHGPAEKFMVGVYETLKYGSCVGSLRKKDGSRFTATLEEARQMLPAEARQLPFVAEDQFLELWEVAEPAAS
jgi:hypothetical protein